MGAARGGISTSAIAAQSEVLGPCFRRTRTDPECIVAGAMQTATNGLTRDAITSRDPFDRRAITMESDGMRVYRHCRLTPDTI
jgi:hypothetical protein